MILVDPAPRTLELICDAPTRARLEALGPLTVWEGDDRMPDEEVERHLPETVAIIGQTAVDAERLSRAPNLRAIVNVEGNFLPNVDYAACRAAGVHVLNASPVFAAPVAEFALAAAIDLARGITSGDRAMRAGEERYGRHGSAGAFVFAGSDVGIAGYGDLGRELHRLLAPFGCRVRIHDPWLPDLVIRRSGAEAVGLEQLLTSSRVLFVFAPATAENRGFISRRELELIPPGGVLALMSRADVVDFDALVDVVAAGRLRAAIDVYPEEPVPADHAVRRLEGALLTPHRAGGLASAFKEMGRLVAADLELVLAGLPPVACKRAEPETAARLRSRPVTRAG